MKKVISTLVCSVILTTLGTGCVGTVTGDKQAAVPFRKDKVFSRYQIPIQDVVDAARYVLASKQGGLGVLQAENRINGSLIAKVDKRTVWVRVKEIEPTVTEVATQVRTAFGWGDIALASEIDKQIALRLQVVISVGK
ncbi:MAG: hypothetical protein ACKVHO_23020 [Verrucomicrobiia bacterium]|jgi:hypothetical protein